MKMHKHWIFKYVWTILVSLLLINTPASALAQITDPSLHNEMTTLPLQEDAVNQEFELITLQSDLSGKYVRGGVNDGRLAAAADRALAWELFRLIPIGVDKLALQSHHNNKFVSASGGVGDYLTLLSDSIQSAEIFTLVPLPDGKFALKSEINGKYVRAGLDSLSLLANTSDSILDWETFRLSYLRRRIISPPGTGSFAIPSNRLWHDNFCLNEELCKMGDFNGDGVDDIAAFARNPANVWVALSNRTGFVQTAIWNQAICDTSMTDCTVGDFNDDGKDDVAEISKECDVNVALSTGSGFAAKSRWGSACAPVKVGDVNGDGYPDLVQRVERGGIDNGRLNAQYIVNRSTGSSFTQEESWFITFDRTELSVSGSFDVADVNGDGRADVVNFAALDSGDVYVFTSDGSTFATPQLWHETFCLHDEMCMTGDVDGDNDADLINFTRDSIATHSERGDVHVALSALTAFVASSVWHDFFCVASEVCAAGDFNGDQRTDIIVFTRNTYTDNRRGDVYVALSSPYEAESWFRPNLNGYHFPNYGDVQDSDFTVDDMRQILGDSAVCTFDTSGQCIEQPAAAQFRRDWLKIMKGGHCYGMAVTSSRFFDQLDLPTSFQAGAQTIHDIEKANARRHIASYFVRQGLEPANSYWGRTLSEAPSQILERVRRTLVNKETKGLTLVIFDCGDMGCSGHAITPYAIDDINADIRRIMVYDNNHPDDLSRFIEVNTQNETWSYDLGGFTWQGSNTTASFGAIPYDLHNATMKCPWCASPSAAVSQVLVTNNVDLLITNEQGQRFGYDGNTFLAEIPDAYRTPIVTGLGTSNPMVYHVPIQGIHTLRLAGSDLTQGKTIAVTQFGTDYAVAVENIRVNPGKQDSLQISADGKQISYQANEAQAIDLTFSLNNAPLLHASQDNPNTSMEGYILKVKGIEIGANQTLGTLADAINGNLKLENTQNAATAYELEIVQVAPSGEYKYTYGTLSLPAETTHHVLYGSIQDLPSGSPPLTILVDQGNNGTVDQTINAPPPGATNTTKMYLPLVIR